MTLVDTSVWVYHLRNGNPSLAEMLIDGQVLCHPFVIGELACGHLESREQTLQRLKYLPAADAAEDAEVLTFIEHHKLAGSGIGWIDAHLLASAVLSGARMWTLDRTLTRVAARFVTTRR